MGEGAPALIPEAASRPEALRRLGRNRQPWPRPKRCGMSRVIRCWPARQPRRTPDTGTVRASPGSTARRRSSWSGRVCVCALPFRSTKRNSVPTRQSVRLRPGDDLRHGQLAPWPACHAIASRTETWAVQPSFRFPSAPRSCTIVLDMRHGGRDMVPAGDSTRPGAKGRGHEWYEMRDAVGGSPCLCEYGSHGLRRGKAAFAGGQSHGPPARQAHLHLGLGRSG